MNFRNITHPEDVKLDEKYILQILAGTIDSFETEKRYIHKKGHDIWITLYSRVVRDENNSVIYVIAVITDITRQKMAEKELRESQERLSLALEVSSTGFWDYYLDTGKTYMSSEIYAMTGYESTEIIQNINTFLDLTHPDDRKTISEIINNSIDSLEPFHIDFRVRHRSGEWMWLSAKGMPADIDENGRPHRLIGTQVNITPRVRAEEALLYAKACADESNRIKSEFLKNVTHELRTPLTAVIGFSDLLLCEDSGKLEGVQREHIGYINQSGQNLLEVVNRMLSFSNTDYCNLNSFEYEDVDVGQMVRDTIDILLTTALKKNIKLLKHVDPALKNVVADREKLKEILYNLVENAIKFTESSGSVNIEVKAVKGSRDAVLFSVKDTGIGIAKEKLDTIFEPFIQIDGSISRKYGGTGLGLALVKKLVEMHNGNIRVESEPGKGSNFIFEIPITPEQ
jgi:PAS domain S-box-containing protein